MPEERQPPRVDTEATDPDDPRQRRHQRGQEQFSHKPSDLEHGTTARGNPADPDEPDSGSDGMSRG